MSENDIEVMTKRDAKETRIPERKEKCDCGAGKTDAEQTEVRLAGQGAATGLVKQSRGRSNKGILGRFRGVGFGQKFLNEKHRKGRGKGDKERDRDNAVEKAKPGSPRHVNDRPGVNCGGGGLVVSGDDSGHKRGKDFRKHSEIPRWHRQKGKLVILSLRVRARSKTMMKKSSMQLVSRSLF
jgi:hypothetical protein